MKKILFICDPIELFKIKTDTTYLFMLTANELHCKIYYTLPSEIYAENSKILAKVKSLKLYPSPNEEPNPEQKWYDILENATANLTDFNAILVRNDPPFDMEYYYLTQLLTLAEKNGAKVINNSNALRNFNEKLSILNFPDLISPTTITKNKEVILEFLQRYGECVIKPLDLMAGRGVFKISLANVNCDAIIETITNYYTQTIMVQKFIPEVVNGDRRIFIINGEVCNFCVHRIPRQNQIRGNLAAGGRAEVHELSHEEYTLAQSVAKWLQEHKVCFAGLDVIGNKLTEINITSPTAARQILMHSGINVTKLLLETILAK